MPANNTQFDIVIPTTLGSQCATAGDCVCLLSLFPCSLSNVYFETMYSGGEEKNSSGESNTKILV